MEKIKTKRILRYLVAIIIFLIFVFLGLWPGGGGDSKDIWDEMEDWRKRD